MNIIKAVIIITGIAGMTFAQITSDAVKKDTEIKISKTMTFQHLNVEGYTDNLTTTYIPGATLDDSMDLRFNRSFKQELSSNVDKETVERMF